METLFQLLHVCVCISGLGGGGRVAGEEVSRESGEEDLGAAGLLRGTYSAGPVSHSCFT